MNKINLLRTFFILVTCIYIPLNAADSAYGEKAPPAVPLTDTAHPNVIIILADDLGFGDLSCYGAKVHQTPHLDKLAAEGLRFTQGYATSATCTPSRFALITGRYPIRHPRASILPGNAGMIITPGSLTLPQIFKNAGYLTGAVGKWHLGLADGKQDWNKEIRPGLNDVGFEYSFIMAATNDRTPTVYIENQRVANLTPEDPLEVNYNANFPGEPYGKKNPELMTRQKSSHGHADSVHNGVGRIGFQRGGVSARWIDEEMAQLFAEKTENFIRSAVKEEKPFFLYYALHQPHVPRIPNPKFSGKSPLGPRGDVILEADAQVGELIALLDTLKIRENTLIIFTSDNGPVLDDGYVDEAVARNTQTGHKPSGILRGGKYSRYDGGMHVPFIVSWPGTVHPGTSSALVCQVDFLASFSHMLGKTPPEKKDSQNVYDALIGLSNTGRSELLLEASKKVSFRTEDWYIVPKGKFPSSGAKHSAELFYLKDDPAQKHDVSSQNPATVDKLFKKMKAILKENK